MVRLCMSWQISLWKHLAGALWFHFSGLSLVWATRLESGALSSILEDLWFVFLTLKTGLLFLLTISVCG